MKILITGVSSGLGRELAKKLVMEGHQVWGIARREELLSSLEKELGSKNFHFSIVDLIRIDAWDMVFFQTRKKKFVPDVVIFNAAVFSQADTGSFTLEVIQKTHQTNFISTVAGVEKLMTVFPKHDIHFILISSSSALKGSAKEGIAYASSKAAVSIAFESFYQRYKGSKFTFTTVSLGPIRGGMNPRQDKRFGPNSLESAIEIIRHAILEKKPLYERPVYLFIMLRLIRLLPYGLSFLILDFLENIYVSSPRKK